MGRTTGTERRSVKNWSANEKEDHIQMGRDQTQLAAIRSSSAKPPTEEKSVRRTAKGRFNVSAWFGPVE